MFFNSIELFDNQKKTSIKQGTFNYKQKNKKSRLQTVRMKNNIFVFLIVPTLIISARWTPEQAQKWYEKYKWGAGFNYAPSYAVNEIEMWDSFNEEVIDRELGWAEEIGFSLLRVFLHAEPFETNSQTFIQKIDHFLDIADKHHHRVILVLFDDCWKSHFNNGTQPDPIPGVHNSQWVQCPGDNNLAESLLESYTKKIILAFRDDSRVIMWDLYNEVGNSNHKAKSLPLTKKIFTWAQTINPSQPLTSGHWNSEPIFDQINHYILSESDIITFHAYCDRACTETAILRMKSLGRPVICTQYMARPLDSKFVTHLPLFKQKDVWAINWGFVFGRTQTYYPWWSEKGSPVPEIWFHDVVHTNGTPFDPVETSFIRNITSEA